MRRQAYPVAGLTGGLDVSVDAVFLTDKSSPNLRNVWFDKGLVRKGLGWAAFGSGLPLAGTVMLIDTFPMQSGTLHYLFATVDWVYRYNGTSYDKKNKTVNTGVIALTFVAATQKMTRGSGSFVTDGFTEGSVLTTDAALNPGPFTITAVAALEVTVSSGIVNEGPVDKTATCQVVFTGDEDNQFTSVVTVDSGVMISSSSLIRRTRCKSGMEVQATSLTLVGGLQVLSWLEV